MLNPRHEQMLRDATIETRDAVRKQIRDERPELFHIESGEGETPSTRRFAYEPATSLPMAGFNVAREVAKATIPAVSRKAE